MAEIGTVLGGRYRLVELLGQGGMATIYRAHDSQLDRDVAVKLLRPEYGRDPEFGSRFRQEAQNAASLNHPNIVSVYDYGQDAAGPVHRHGGGRGRGPRVDHPPLRCAAAAPGRPDRRPTTARALEAAHARGIVHRDVKPGNIMISRDGRVKVTDFGIARAVAEAQMTLPGTTLGSVHYFSPEQARGEQATAASDIFALGIVLFELLTGQRPWEGDTRGRRWRWPGSRVRSPTRPRKRAGIPPELAGDHPQGAGDASPRTAGRPPRASRRRSRRSCREPRSRASAAIGRRDRGRRAAAALRRGRHRDRSSEPQRDPVFARRLRRTPASGHGRTPTPAAALARSTTEENGHERHRLDRRRSSRSSSSPLAGFLVFRLLSGDEPPASQHGRGPELRRHDVHRRPGAGRGAWARGRPGPDDRRRRRSVGTVLAQDPPAGTESTRTRRRS